MSAGAPRDAAAGPAAAPSRSRPVGEIVFPLAVVALGGYVLSAAGTINVPLTSGAMGPRTMPYLVGVLLVGSALAALVGVLRGGGHVEAEDGEDVDPDAATDWRTVGILVGIVLVHIVLIRPLGWPVAATVLFAGTAVTLGARPVWRALLLGAVLALLIQAAMAGGLGISLPAGPFLERITILRG